MEQTARAPKKTDTQPTTVTDGAPIDNLIMISNKRSRVFYERAAREILASGHDFIHLSALGDAAVLAIQLANSLQDKKAATITKIETKYVETPSQGQKNFGLSRPTGISITLQKHPDFKGTRIIPSFVIFCPELADKSLMAYPKNTNAYFGSVNYGNRQQQFDLTTTGDYFKLILGDLGKSTTELEALYQYLLTEALKPNKDKTEMDQILFVGELDAVKNYSKNLQAAFCRVCPKLKDIPGKSALGSVFFYVFADEKPHANAYNSCMIHLVAPKKEDFPSRQDFIQAVTLTATNLMTALCDFNGYVKRNPGTTPLKRLNVVRVPLFSSTSDYIHQQTTQADVAKAILKGLDEGYHFGTAPKLNFFDPDKHIQQAWLDASGQSEDALFIESEHFVKKQKNEKETR